MRLIGSLLFALTGLGVLVGLGVWQLQRLEWKEALIARLEARLSAAPIALPAQLDAERDAFLRVTAEGTLASERADVLTTKRPFGPGYRTLSAVALADGRRIVVDFGFIVDERRGEGLPAPGTPVSLTGALFWPEGGDSFTPEPDLADNLFFSREVPPLAAALNTKEILIVADTHSLGPRPLAERLGVNLPNNHRGYAYTWFSLAAVWAVMCVLFARTRLTRRPLANRPG
ncbi:MAG: SURF1 family protein [Pseudomonadota bacterium]